jgi:hypothetical protein
VVAPCCILFGKTGTNKLPGGFGSIKLPRVRLKNSGEKFTKEFRINYVYPDLDKIEKRC